MRPRLTFTGIDEQTDLQAIQALQDQWPGIEFALLWSETNTKHRYPSGGWIAQTLATWGAGRLPAVHVCGEPARRAFIDVEPCRTAVAVAPFVMRYAGRVQINGRVGYGTFDFLEIGRATGLYRGEVITQCSWDPAIPEESVCRHFFCPEEAFLMDGSGGCGVVPGAWTMPPASVVGKCPVGFAGGLSAENVGVHLPRILEVAQGRLTTLWIDMESSLRIDDRFSIDRVKKTIDVVESIAPGWLMGGPPC